MGGSEGGWGNGRVSSEGRGWMKEDGGWMHTRLRFVTGKRGSLSALLSHCWLKSLSYLLSHFGNHDRWMSLLELPSQPHLSRCCRQKGTLRLWRMMLMTI